MAASRRAKIIYKLAQLIAERASDIALLEVRDNGKALATAKGELSAIVDCFEFYAGAATKNYGETLPPPLPTYLASTVREPVGVVGAIVGGWLFGLIGHVGITGFNLYSMFVAVIGSVVVLIVYHAIRRIV